MKIKKTNRNGWQAGGEPLFLENSPKVGLLELILLLVLALITLYPLLSGGFTTHDDLGFALSAWNGTAWANAKSLAIDQGRFAFYWCYPLYVLPYIIDNRIWYLIFKFGSLLLMLISIYFAISQCFKSKWIAYFVLLIFLAFIQNGWEHNALTSYVFTCSFIASLFFVSLGIFAKSIDQHSICLGFLSGALYFFTLGYELFVLLFPLYLAIAWSRAPSSHSIYNRLIYAKKYVSAVAIWLIAYLIIYAVWRHIHPSNYDGNSTNGQFDLMSIVNVVATYSLSALPLASFNIWLGPGDPSPTGWHEIFSRLNVGSFIKPLVVGLLFVRFLKAKNLFIDKPRILLAGAAVAGFGVFVPNLLLGLVQRHQDWVAAGFHSYLYTYYSFISFTIFLALIITYFSVKSRTLHRYLQIVFAMSGIFILTAISFAVEIRNQYIAHDQNLAHREWVLMQEVVQSPSFLAIPNGSTITSPTLLGYKLNIAAVLPADWTAYVRYKTGKSIRFLDGGCKVNINCYFFVYHQVAETGNQFAVLSRLDNPASMLSSDVTIYAMQDHGKQSVIGSYASLEVSPRLFIDGRRIDNIGNGKFSAPFPDIDADKQVQVARLYGDVDIIPTQITFSSYAVNLHFRRLLDELAEGINFSQQSFPDYLSEVSGLSGAEVAGRWSDGKNVVFTFQQSLPSSFILKIDVAAVFGPNVGKAIHIRIGDWVGQFVPDANTLAGKTLTLQVHNQNPTNVIEITIASPTSPKEIGMGTDYRKLGVMFKDIKIISD